MTTWTTAQVAALSPDAASLKAGEKLSQPHQWQTLGQADGVLWGEIKGSGKNPYQTAIALAEPAFKCSCPSRKFPCKHGLGLALVFAAHPDKFTGNEPPVWLQEWLEKRGQRAQKQADKAAAKDEPVDEATLQKRAAAQQKRNAAREDKVNAGITELQRWLSDLIRQGLANSDDNQWQGMAARMVDAQAPGLARSLQNAASLRYQGGAWQEKLLAELGFDTEMGARPLRRVIQQKVEDPLSDKLLSGEFQNGNSIQVTLDPDGEVILEKIGEREAEPEEAPVV